MKYDTTTLGRGQKESLNTTRTASESGTRQQRADTPRVQLLMIRKQKFFDYNTVRGDTRGMTPLKLDYRARH